MHNFGTCVWRTGTQWRLLEKIVFRRRKNRILPLRCSSAKASPKVVHRPRSQSPLQFDIRTHSKFTREHNFPALGVCFPQPCSSAGRMFAMTRSRLQYYRRIVSFPKKNSMKCVVNWIPLRFRVRSRNTQPHLNKTGLFWSGGTQSLNIFMTKRSDIIVTDRFFCALFRKSCLLQRFASSFRSMIIVILAPCTQEVGRSARN